MSKPKALNPPERIFLQVGEIDEDCQFHELAEGEVTWCADSQFDTDIEYRLVKRRSRRTREQVIKAAMRDVGLAQETPPEYPYQKPTNGSGSLATILPCVHDLQRADKTVRMHEADGLVGWKCTVCSDVWMPALNRGVNHD